MNSSDLDDKKLTSSSESDECLHESTYKRPRKRAKYCRETKKKNYPIKTAYVPKKIFTQTLKKLRTNRSILDREPPSVFKLACDKGIFGNLSKVLGPEWGRTSAPISISPESTTRVIIEMRECLIRQDYYGLAQLICLFTEMPTSKVQLYQTFIKYCVIAIMNDPLVKGTGLLDLFLECVIGCKNDDEKQIFHSDISHIPINIQNIKKYKELWEETDDKKTDNVNEMNIDKFCRILNRKYSHGNTENNDRESDTEDDDDDNDDKWVSCDENDLDELNKETSEVDNVIDLSDRLAKLETELT